MIEKSNDSNEKPKSLRDGDMRTHSVVSRRLALSTLGIGASGALAVVLGVSRGTAADAGDSDQTTVADYKWRSNSDTNTYGDTTQTDARDGSDVTDSDQTVVADTKSTPDSDVRHVADARDRD